MASRTYTGRRSSGGRRGRGSGPLDPGMRTVIRCAFFPALLLYLELVLHISAGTSLKYLPVWLMFSAAAGLLLGALTLPFSPRVNAIVAKVLAVGVTLIYAVETFCKKILQSYYGFSSLGTAAGNRLTDYAGAVFQSILANIPLILLYFLPAVLFCVLAGRYVGFERYDVRFSGVLLIGMVLFHLVGLLAVRLPWSGDLTPAKLYKVDTNIDDKVEQLGTLTMLRLDLKYMIFPPKNALESDFSGLTALGKPTPKPAESTPAESLPPEETPEPTPVIDTSPNVMDVDLAGLAENGANKDIQWLANYFGSVTPTNKNQYTGMFEGYNVIEIVMEGFSGYVIDPELTPTLYKLTHEGFVFNNYYTALHFTSTSNGECQTLLGLYPKNGSPITMTRTGELGTNAYFSLPQQLLREGYEVLGYHGNYNMYGRQVSHSNLGYIWKQHGSGLSVDLKDNGDIAWPARDSQVVENSVDDYINSDKPFHVYYLTISGHMPYSNNRVVAPYRDTVRALTQYSETTQNYIATAMELDKSLELLLDKLEEAGKLDKTLIVATGDHIPYFNVDTLEELTGKKFGSSEDLSNINEKNIDFDVYKNSLILWSASMTEPVEVDKVCCQVDILPTVSNLLGLEYDSRMLAGSDILSDSEGLVVFSSRSWKSDRGFYRFTGEFTPADGVSMSAEEQQQYVEAMKKLVGYKLDSTSLIVENDFYEQVFPRSKQYGKD